MQSYFPFSQIIGNVAERINRTIVRHNYSAPWTVTKGEVKVQPVAVVAERPITEIYY